MAELKPFELIIRAESDSKGTAVELKYVQELVRCKECKWYERDLCANPWGDCCRPDWVIRDCGCTVDDDGFCYRGERKDDGEQKITG